MLEIRNLEKKFVQADREFWAAKDVNLSVSEGDFISIIGRSGSGKSTLLNMIAGLLEPTKGQILFDNKDITSLSDEEVSIYRNTDIGYIMQGKSLLKNLTVLDNVLLPYYLFSRDEDITKRALELLDQVGILHLKDTYPSKLSGGELRRVAIARALINNPKLLLADEPTSDLDSENTAEIMKLFQKISSKGTAVIMVTHELDTLRFGNDVYRMDGGSISKEAENAIA